mmetsp:Transcript_18183/g.40403  ORF Transcript_18183/g.40403 Transcript_18183/m.40403 type:complete len:182 (-) Transcript_18183:35-580(-)
MCNIILGFKRLIQLHSRNGRPDDVEYVRLDLACRTCQSIPCIVCGFCHHPILHSYTHLHEDIILGLSLAEHIELLHSERQPPRNRLKRPEDARRPFANKSLELSKILHYTDLLFTYALQTKATVPHVVSRIISTAFPAPLLLFGPKWVLFRPVVSISRLLLPAPVLAVLAMAPSSIWVSTT